MCGSGAQTGMMKNTMPLLLTGIRLDLRRELIACRVAVRGSMLISSAPPSVIGFFRSLGTTAGVFVVRRCVFLVSVFEFMSLWFFEFMNFRRERQRKPDPSLRSELVLERSEGMTLLVWGSGRFASINWGVRWH